MCGKAVFKSTIIIVCLSVVTCKEYRDVEIKQGWVRGYQSSEGIFEFHGIPYATTPTGPDRYKAPLPPPTWTKLFEATERHIACPQQIPPYKKPTDANATYREDCLIANVYISNTDKKNLPVVVFIHGGAFLYGYGDNHPPTKLVKDTEIIAVTFNYRLGPQGFLCLGTEDVPGNAAMKDQVALLRWVQDNIASFGGNPNSVTISGCSAGGTSVDLHVVSKLSRGLFHRAIAGSGSCVASFGVQVDPIENAKHYAKMLNFSDVNDTEKLESFYKNASLSFLNSVSGFIMDREDASVMFSPCIEKDLGQEMFLDSFPFTNNDYHPVPMLYGLTNMEGMTRLPFLPKWKHTMNERFYDFLPEDLSFETEKERHEIGEQVKEFYFGNRTVGSKTAVEFVNFFTDRLFMKPIMESLEKHLAAGNNEVYFYEYLFYDKSLPNSRYKVFQGAKHCAQEFIVLDETDEDKRSDGYKHMKSVMRELWSNFIIAGKPVPEGSKLPSWPPVRKNGTPFMSINSELQLKWKKTKLDRIQLWNTIYGKHYRKPVPPT